MVQTTVERNWKYHRLINFGGLRPQRMMGRVGVIPREEEEREEDLLITLSRSSQTELQRAQLNEVGPKELCCRLGARPLNTIHV